MIHANAIRFSNPRFLRLWRILRPLVGSFRALPFAIPLWKISAVILFLVVNSHFYLGCGRKKVESVAKAKKKGGGWGVGSRVKLLAKGP
jgi:hypothetical protein